MYMCREEKGKGKKDGLCNYGEEMAHSEIAAFHLHRYVELMFLYNVIQQIYVKTLIQLRSYNYIDFSLLNTIQIFCLTSKLYDQGYAKI